MKSEKCKSSNFSENVWNVEKASDHRTEAVWIKYIFFEFHWMIYWANFTPFQCFQKRKPASNMLIDVRKITKKNDSSKCHPNKWPKLSG